MKLNTQSQIVKWDHNYVKHDKIRVGLLFWYSGILKLIAIVNGCINLWNL